MSQELSFRLSAQLFSNRALVDANQFRSSDLQIRLSKFHQTLIAEPVDGRAPRALAKQMTSAIRWEARASVVSPYLESQKSSTPYCIAHCFHCLTFWRELLNALHAVSSQRNLKHFTCSCTLHNDTHLNRRASLHPIAPPLSCQVARRSHE